MAALLGSVDPATGERCIRGLFLLAPKKSSKTTYGAALMLTALLVNTRPRAEHLLIAPTKIIADLSYSQAVGMIEANDELKNLVHVQDHLRQVTHLRTKAQLKIKAFDSGVLTGVKPAAVLVDELHEVAEKSGCAADHRPTARRIAAEPGGVFGLHHHAERSAAGWHLPNRVEQRARDSRWPDQRQYSAGALRVS